MAVPHVGDMAENAARARLGRAPACGCRGALLSPTTLRLAVRRALADARLGARAASWRPGRRHDGATRAAELVEAMDA